MRKFRFIIFILAVFTCFLFTGCVVEDQQQEEPPVLDIQLKTPENISVHPYSGQQIVFFDEVENAIGYQINVYLEEKLVKRYEVTSNEAKAGVLMSGLEAGSYKLNVRALANKELGQVDSALSEYVEFEVKGTGPVNPVKYTVTFDTDGGSSIVSQLVSSGSKAIKPKDPTKDGFEFVCWMLDNSEYDFDTPVTKDITLKATWKKGQGENTDPEYMEYYKTIKGLTGNALKTELRRIISTGVKSTSYNDLRSTSTGLPYTDADPEKSGNIILFYGHVSVNNNTSNWNREHVWPKSLGWFQTSGAGSDIHHIRPENDAVNSRRGNLKMGLVNGGTNNKYSTGESGGYYTSSLYEPVDSVKGDIARIYMYMLIRYAQTDSSYPITNVISSMNLLLEWHKADPVDEFEKVRNERSYQVQGNRNPFIDYPELASMIWG